MRSYVLTAALAAALLSTSLTLGYAASPTNPATGAARGSCHAPTRCRPATIYPAKPVAYQVMRPGSRLSRIDSELSAANRRIDADRHHGQLTAMELRRVRSDERAIRAAAAEAARQERRPAA